MEIDKKERALWEKGKTPRKRLINRYNKYYDPHQGKTLLGPFSEFIWRGHTLDLDKKFATLDFKDIKLFEEGRYFTVDITQPGILYAAGKTYEV